MKLVYTLLLGLLLACGSDNNTRPGVIVIVDEFPDPVEDIQLITVGRYGTYTEQEGQKNYVYYRGVSYEIPQGTNAYPQILKIKNKLYYSANGDLYEYDLVNQTNELFQEDIIFFNDYAPKRFKEGFILGTNAGEYFYLTEEGITSLFTLTEDLAAELFIVGDTVYFNEEEDGVGRGAILRSFDGQSVTVEREYGDFLLRRMFKVNNKLAFTYGPAIDQLTVSIFDPAEQNPVLLSDGNWQTVYQGDNEGVFFKFNENIIHYLQGESLVKLQYLNQDITYLGNIQGGYFLGSTSTGDYIFKYENGNLSVVVEYDQPSMKTILDVYKRGDVFYIANRDGSTYSILKVDAQKNVTNLNLNKSNTIKFRFDYDGQWTYTVLETVNPPNSQQSVYYLDETDQEVLKRVDFLYTES